MDEQTSGVVQASAREVTQQPIENNPSTQQTQNKSRRRFALVVMFVVLLWAFWRNVAPMFVTQQQVYSYLDESCTQLRNLRAAKVDDASWDSFRQRTLTKLATFIPKLEKDADVSDPASLSLLAVSRDYLPTLLKAENRFSNETESRMNQHLAIARQAMSQESPTAISAEFWMMVFGSLNAGIVLWAGMFVAKKLLVRVAR